MQLAERARPQALPDVVAQDAAIKKLTTIADWRGRALWFSGQSGTGKTTLARIVASEVADDCCIEELDAGDVTAEWIRAVRQSQWVRGLGKGGRAYVINEAHGLRAEIVRKLLTVLEPIPPHVVWCFTTTIDGQESLFEDAIDAGPLLSRCYPVRLAQRDLTKPFAAHVVKLARAEGLLNGKGDPYYLARAERLLKDKRNNLRAALMEVEAGYLTASDEH